MLEEDEVEYVPVDPARNNPNTPTFQAPFGVDPQQLRDAGVGHAYYGVGKPEPSAGVFQGKPKTRKHGKHVEDPEDSAAAEPVAAPEPTS